MCSDGAVGFPPSQLTGDRSLPITPRNGGWLVLTSLAVSCLPTTARFVKEDDHD